MLLGSPPARAVVHRAPTHGCPAPAHARPCAGEVLFGTDSHTCNAGAFGQFATGVGNTDAGFILGTGKLLIKVPPTMRFALDGQMPPWLQAKDLILHIIGEISVAGEPPARGGRGGRRGCGICRSLLLPPPPPPPPPPLL